jgi:hypothetical protein
LHCFDRKYDIKTNPLFQFDKILPRNEKVIKVLIRAQNFDTLDYLSIDNNQRIPHNLKIIYLTNYGRFNCLSIGINLHIRFDNCNNKFFNGINLQGINDYLVQNKQLCYKHNQQPIPNSTLSPLTHKFPKLFLNVINALRAESTDDMQKCCEYYYSRIHEKDKLEKENKKLSAECESLKTKNKQLEKENQELREKIQVLEVDNARDKIQEQDQRIQKLLMEIELLKIKNIEVRRLYKE